jgi:aminoglycoside phosphotransferase (APT) family kinase protein
VTEESDAVPTGGATQSPLVADSGARDQASTGKVVTDPALIAERLAPWLEERLQGNGPVTITSLAKPGSGLSGGTFLVDAHRNENDYRLVLRIPPPDGDGVFPYCDLPHEARVQEALRSGGVPVAPSIGIEHQTEILGGPFVVTGRVEGLLIDSSDPYLSRGWLHDASPEVQTLIAKSFMEVLAGIHRIDPSAVYGQSSETWTNEAAHKRWHGYLLWAGPEVAPDLLHEAFAWCEQNLPSPEPAPSLLWGDGQLANAVYSEHATVAAVLDFELASAGPAELDLGWLFSLHDMTVARCGEELPGFADRAGLVAYYEERLGRGVEDLSWYEIFGAACTGAILVRMASLFSRGGTDLSWLARSNPAIDYLNRKIN